MCFLFCFCVHGVTNISNHNQNTHTHTHTQLCLLLARSLVLYSRQNFSRSSSSLGASQDAHLALAYQEWLLRFIVNTVYAVRNMINIVLILDFFMYVHHFVSNMININVLIASGLVSCTHIILLALLVIISLININVLILDFVMYTHHFVSNASSQPTCRSAPATAFTYSWKDFFFRTYTKLKTIIQQQQQQYHIL
jgi:hypothetical protein